MDREDIRYSLKTFGSLVAVTLLNFFICLSFLFIFTAISTEEIGYHATVYSEDGKQAASYTYYEKSGEDTEAAKYPEAEGYRIDKKDIRNDLSGKGLVGFRIITQIFTTLTMVGFIYPAMWSLGSKDSNRVRFKRKKSESLRGLKIGLIAKIPAALILIGFLTLGRNLQLALYGLINSTYFPIIDLVGRGGTVGEVSLGGVIVLISLLFIAPAVCAVAYFLGFKDISISERIIYSNKKKGKE